MKINDSGATARLEQIAGEIGARVGAEFPRIDPGYMPVDEIIDGESVKDVFHPSGLLIRDGRPIFVYIRDHTVRDHRIEISDYINDPSSLRKVHFSFCKTLEQMKRENRYHSRYHVTNHTDNQYYIDVQVQGYQSREYKVPLYPCKFCLDEVGYKCFTRRMPQHAKQEIVESFDAKDALDLLQQHFEEFRKHTVGLRPDTATTGYAPNQGDISARDRKRKNHVCEMCGRKGSRSTTETHHKDSNKRNNNTDNLQCLCRPCHAKMHPHYRL